LGWYGCALLLACYFVAAAVMTGAEFHRVGACLLRLLLLAASSAAFFFSLRFP
jgi:hypothetical protein